MTNSFTIPQEIYTKLLKKYRPSSIKTLTFNIKRVLKYFNIKDYSIEPFLSPNDIFDYLDTIDNICMSKTLLLSILAFIKLDSVPETLIKEYEKKLTKIARIVTNQRNYIEPTLAEKNNYITWYEVINTRKRYKKIVQQINSTQQDQYTYLKYTLLSLYTKLPPLRGEEYLNSIVTYNGDPKTYKTIWNMTGKNILDIKNNKFIVFVSKTSKVHGIRVLNIPYSLSQIIRKFTSITKSNILLPNIKKLPNEHIQMSPEALTQMFFKIFEPKKVSTSMLRKIFISEFLKTERTPAERKILAHVMNHSLREQEFIYKRFK